MPAVVQLPPPEYTAVSVAALRRWLEKGGAYIEAVEFRKSEKVCLTHPAINRLFMQETMHEGGRGGGGYLDCGTTH